MAMGLAAVALMGLPPSGAFVAKWLWLLEAIRTGQFHVASVIVIGSLLAAFYSFRILQHAFTEPDGEHRSRQLPWRLLWPPLCLALAAVLLGLLAHPLWQLADIGRSLPEVSAPTTHSTINSEVR
jgi:multicomponent Na+:H+ antiporter subunit D